MTFPLILVMAAALPAAEETPSPFARALTHETPWVVRGQDAEAAASGPVLSAPVDGTTTYYQADPYAQGSVAPYGLNPFGQPGYPGPVTGDPWAGGVTPYAAPGMMYGVNGPQPHRLGWRAFYDVSFLPNGNSQSPAMGDLDIFAVDIEKRLTMPWAGNWIFQIAPQFAYRSYQGPDSTPVGMPPVAGPALPGSAFGMGVDFVLQTPNVGGFSYEFAFNPTVGTDFNGGFSSDAVMFDGRAVMYWSWGPQWTWAIGAQYWDRADDIVIPYAGVIWNPDQFWEFQLIFPKPKVSVFLGTPLGIATWLYATGEYHVEAYEMQPAPGLGSTRVQFEDWRVLGGLKWDAGWLQSFAEAGYVFGRDVEMQGLSKFDVSSGFIGRVGFRY
ncbi:MAG: hypothetical protein KDA58_08030 [Planctomycetaceae bacterium]|nr:hypothetical protein [Planctomycetaceae bacterium]